MDWRSKFQTYFAHAFWILFKPLGILYSVISGDMDDWLGNSCNAIKIPWRMGEKINRFWFGLDFPNT